MHCLIYKVHSGAFHRIARSSELAYVTTAFSICQELFSKFFHKISTFIRLISLRLKRSVIIPKQELFVNRILLKIMHKGWSEIDLCFDILYHAAYDKKQGGFRHPAKPSKRSGIYIFNDAVTSVISLIDHRKSTVCFFITEGKETVAQQVHLQNGFFTGHKLQIEAFDSHDLDLIFRFIGNKGRDHLRFANKCICPQTLGKSGLVLPDLPLDGADAGIDGSEHIGCAFAGPEVGVGAMNRDFDLVAVLFHAEGDHRIGFILEIALQLCHFFLSIGMDIGRKADLLFCITEIHSRRSFLLGRELCVPCAYYTTKYSFV